MPHARNGKEAHRGLTHGLHAARRGEGNARRARLTGISGLFHKGPVLCFSSITSVKLHVSGTLAKTCSRPACSWCISSKLPFRRSVYVSLLPNNFIMTQSSLSSAQKPYRLPIAFRAHSSLERDVFEVPHSFEHICRTPPSPSPEAHPPFDC